MVLSAFVIGRRRVFDGQGGWNLATEDLDSSFSIQLLHTLFLCFFEGLCGCFIAFHLCDVVGIVDVP
jgi:hypothetical protein